MRILIVNNLGSGTKGGTIYTFMRSIASDGCEAIMRCTDGHTDLRSLVYDATDFDLVVACGGDGTVSTIAYELAYTNTPILPYPSGTANLICSNLLSPTEPHAIGKLPAEGTVLDFDLGELIINGHRYGFGLMAGCGYDAAIMQHANPNKPVFGPLAYFGAAVANATPQVSKITLTVDGITHETEGFGILLINFSKFQFDISITHDNHPRDGLLDVAVLKGSNAFALIPAIAAALLDREGKNPGRGECIEFYQGREIYIDADPPMYIEYDGEATDARTPFTARVLPSSTRFLVTDECAKFFSK